MSRRLHVVEEPVKGTWAFSRIEDAITAMRAGQMVIVVDDEDRENEGDLTIAAEKITPQAINFMAQYGRGLICLAMTPERLDALEIPLMVLQKSSRFETAFCVSIEAREGTTTGLPTEYGEFRLHAFENQIDKQTHVALVRGDVGDGAGHPRACALAVSHWRCFSVGALRLRRTT